MNELANRLRHVSWWLAPLAVIAAAIVLEAEFGRGMDPQPPVEAPVEPKPVVTALLPEYVIEGGAAARTDTVQRTLFNPTRRPAPALADKGVSRMQRGQFTLAGTLLIDGNNTAYLKEANGGKQRRVKQGEQINGMTVAEIKPDRVRLTLGDEAEEITLKVATNPRPTPTVAAAVPAAAAPTQVPPAGATAPGGTATPANATDDLARRRAAARAAAAGNSPTGVPPAASVAPAPAAAAAAVDPAWADTAKALQQPVAGWRHK